MGIVFNYIAFERRRCNCTARLNLVFVLFAFLLVTEKPWSYCGMALQPHVKRHCPAAIVASSDPTKRTKAKFDELMKWVEAHDRLPKRLSRKKKGDLLKRRISFRLLWLVGTLIF